MKFQGYYIKNPEGIQNLGKASTQRVADAMQETLGVITETRIKLNRIRADIANAKEREEQSRARDNESRDANRIVGRA